LFGNKMPICTRPQVVSGAHATLNRGGAEVPTRATSTGRLVTIAIPATLEEVPPRLQGAFDLAVHQPSYSPWQKH